VPVGAATDPQMSGAFNRASWSASLSARERPANNVSALLGPRRRRGQQMPKTARDLGYGVIHG